MGLGDMSHDEQRMMNAGIQAELNAQAMKEQEARMRARAEQITAEFIAGLKDGTVKLDAQIRMPPHILGHAGRPVGEQPGACCEGAPLCAAVEQPVPGGGHHATVTESKPAWSFGQKVPPWMQCTTVIPQTQPPIYEFQPDGSGRTPLKPTTFQDIKATGDSGALGSNIILDAPIFKDPTKAEVRSTPELAKAIHAELDESELRAYREENRKLKNELESKREYLQQIHTELSERTSERDHARNKHAGAQKYIQSILADNRSLGKKYDEVCERNDQLDVKLESTNAAIVNNKDTIRELEACNKRQFGMIRTRDDKIIQMANENAKLQPCRTRDTEEAFVKLQAENKDLLRQIDEYVERCKNMGDTIAKYQSEAKVHLSNMFKIRSQRDGLTRECADRGKLHAEALGEIAALNERFNKAAKIYGDDRNRIYDLERKLEAKKPGTAEISADWAKERKEHLTTANSYGVACVTIRQLEEKNREMAAEIDKLKRDKSAWQPGSAIDLLAKSADQLEKENVKLRTKIAEQDAQNQQQCWNANTQNSHYVAAFKVIKNLKAQLEESRVARIKQDSDLEKSRQEVVDYVKAYNKSEADLQEAENDLDELVSRFKRCDKCKMVLHFKVDPREWCKCP